MSLDGFNYFDWAQVGIVVISMVLAFRRGLVRAIFSLMGFIGGFQMATWFYTTVAEWLRAGQVQMSVQTSRMLAFVLIVVAVAIVVDQAGRLLQRVLRTVGLGLFDRVLGMAFGFARGCLIAMAVLMITS